MFLSRAKNVFLNDKLVLLNNIETQQKEEILLLREEVDKAFEEGNVQSQEKYYDHIEELELLKKSLSSLEREKN